MKTLPMDTDLILHLKSLAFKYENEKFLVGDPSWFMHQVQGERNKELLAFIASCLSYGSRKQFLPKIQFILDSAKKSFNDRQDDASRGRQDDASREKQDDASRESRDYESYGEVFYWIASGAFKKDIPDDPERCFYRLYTFATMHKMLSALQELVSSYGSMKNYVGKGTCLEAIEKIVEYFSARGIEGIIPKNTKSSCKRICMFLRWMVRDNSPVDIGLWSDIIDKRTLIMPMDTHVMQEAHKLGLIKSTTASMSTAIQLTNTLREIFPDDPLKGDFALFGVGVDEGS